MNDNTFNVNSYNQQGGITAGQVNIGKVKRRISPAFAAQTLDFAHKYQGRKIRVISAMGDAESFNFATQIKSLLEFNGYKVDGVDQVMTVPPLTGEHIGETQDGGIEFRIGSQV